MSVNLEYVNHFYWIGERVHIAAHHILGKEVKIICYEMLELDMEYQMKLDRMIWRMNIFSFIDYYYY